MGNRISQEDSPFIAAIGKKKLCVVSGYEEFLPNPKDDDTRSPKDRWNSYDWSKAGEIYDPDTNSWTCVDAPMEHFREYRSLGAALAVDKDEILFPCRADQSIVFCNLTAEVYIVDKLNSLDILHPLTHLKPPTDTIWFHPPIPVLLGLPNGDLLVIVKEDGGGGARNLTLACLTVSREGNYSLNVSLRYFQPFSVDGPFVLHDGKTMLKNKQRTKGLTATSKRKR
ncbi:hypothetical protein K7X08_012428 [Anisodus acutangulus]|uniref:Uncharacterized protein n=1 Tax=Anisodus acutangulus TaxID=402998 RepID=A0A9Q1QY77_9SOLA|nr:hypothetical protein K7X08_012428 [Anisodus acutangulus]